MATMTISLPEPMKRWIEAQAASGRVESADELLRGLIRREQERTDKIAAMQRLVDEARAAECLTGLRTTCSRVHASGRSRPASMRDLSASRRAEADLDDIYFTGA